MKDRRAPSFSLSLPDETADQVRAALQAVGTLEGYVSVNDLLTAATLKELRRLQRKYNKSRPWDGVGPGALRPGMRTRAEQSTRQQEGRGRGGTGLV